MTAALRRETRKERASQHAKTGRTASAGWNFVVRMVLGKRQPASTPTQPSLDRSTPSHRSSPTIQSKYYFLMVHISFFLSQVWPDPHWLHEMRRRVCMEGRKSWTQRLLRGLKMLSVFFLAYSTYKLSCPLIDVVNHVDHMRAVPYLGV